MRRQARGILLAGLALGTACTVGPDYQRPQVKLTDTFRDQVKPADARSFADLPWWDVFDDEAMKELIVEALQNNYDLRIAVARVEQARAQAGIARAQAYPAVGLGMGAGYGRGTFIPGTTNPPIGTGQVPQRGAQFNIEAGFSWELDLWGKFRRGTEAAVAQFLASEDGRRAVLISLIADVASAYIVLRQLDAQLEISQRTVKNYEKTLELYTARLEGGTGSRLEVATGQAQVNDAQATAYDLQRQINDQENLICLLLGRPPSPIPRGRTLAAFTIPPEIPAGLPATLLERRPDVHQAEELLIAANAKIGVAKANFFPTISLTGVMGLASPDLTKLFTGPSFLWNVSGTASWLAPILQGAQLNSQYEGAWASWQEFLANYEKSVITALREVASSLNDTAQLKPVLEQRESQVKSLTDAVNLALDRYEGGVSSYLEVTTNQNSLFPAELNLAAVRAQRYLALISLYRALGGGWQVPKEASAAAAAPAPAAPPADAVASQPAPAPK
jgi:multidrug efflux system outer membrane protein